MANLVSDDDGDDSLIIKNEPLQQPEFGDFTDSELGVIAYQRWPWYVSLVYGLSASCNPSYEFTIYQNSK